MGHQRSRLHIQFEDLPGLEIWARSVSVRKALRLMRLADEMQALQASGGATAQDEGAAQLEELFTEFATRIDAWTLEEDDGTPITPSADALLDWDFGEAMRMVLAWISHATSVTLPLAQPATGPSPVEASIPMSPVTPDSPSGM